jgi:hypothetical protein
MHRACLLACDTVFLLASKQGDASIDGETKQSAGGKARAAKLTPEARSAIGEGPVDAADIVAEHLRSDPRLAGIPIHTTFDGDSSSTL